MRKIAISLFMMAVTLMNIISCDTSPLTKIQGVYEVDKESLKKNLQSELEGENSLSTGLLSVVLENAVIEFSVRGDSIKGILFMAGKTTLLDSKITERNDSLIIIAPELEAYISPTENGLSYSAKGSDIQIKLNKVERTDLSAETKKAMEAQRLAAMEKEEFENNLGKWQEGSFVDEFGDKTGRGFAYCIIRGTSENSITMKSEVYVKAMIQSEKLYFDIYNSSFTLKESLPDSKFGKIKLKFPDGKVDSQRVFFYNNTVAESEDNALLFNYITEYDGPVKVLIDLSTASRIYSDKYQFTIEKNNLTEIQESLR